MLLAWRSVIGRSPETAARERYLITKQENQDSWTEVNYEESGAT